MALLLGRDAFSYKYTKCAKCINRDFRPSRRLFSFYIRCKNKFIDKSTNVYAWQTQQQPHYGECRAYLAHEVKEHIRIVPDLPAESEIDETSNREFKSCYDSCAHY